MKISWLYFATALCMAVSAFGAVRPGDSTKLDAVELFEDELIPHVRIEISDANLDRLRQRPRTYVTATVREGPAVYTNVSIRLKGGPGSFRRLDDKPAFTVNFGRTAPGQKFHGLKKLHLNNSVQDRSYLGEKISRELFNQAGVPAPRAGHAWVELNGRPLGFYVLIEGIDKHFLKRYFTDTGGTLYDGHSQSEVNRKMRTNSGENRSDYTRLAALSAAAQESDLSARQTALEETLDLDRFISFLATEIMLCHWDGYALNRNNFRIFHDRTADRFVFIPQGADQVFQRQNTEIFPQMIGLVAKSVLAVPEFRQRYRDRMAELVTNVWKANILTNHIYAVGAKVHQSLMSEHSDEAGSYPARVAAFSRRVQQRVRFLERTLVAPSAEPSFNNDGVVSISSWQSHTDRGTPTLRKDSSDNNHTLLYIGADADAAASWRSQVALDRGRYRLEGRVRWQAVELNADDPKTGVGLRISRRKFTHQLPADSPWTTMTFEFEVAQDNTPVELVCELRANRGEVWFDQNSLRLMRQDAAP